MIKKAFFPVLLLLLGWALFISPTVKEVAAGVAILLFGMIMLEEGFNAFVQGPLQKLLRRVTDKLYKSLGLGFITTAFLQSSSLISVITISFLSAGLIELHAGIGIIFGANLGTTATAWLVSIFGLNIKVSALAMPMLAFGILFVFQKTKNLKGIGYILAGLGFFFLGIHFMKQGFDVYQDSINLADYSMPGFWGLIIYTFIGIIITLILQSSSAAMALILTALAVGQITYNNSLALAIGANVGTTITAIVGSLTSNVEGKRLAGAHLIFNLVTGLIALVFIGPFGQLVDFISSSTGIAPDNYPIKLSIFHTVFNLTGVIVMVPFVNPLVKGLTKMFVEKKKVDKIEHPVYLNQSVLAYPQTALRALLNESKRLFEKATFEIVAHGLNLHITDIVGDEKLKNIIRKSNAELDIDIDELYYNKVKIIYSKIIKYATLAQSKFPLLPKTMETFTRIKLANRNIVETIKSIRGLRKNVNHYMLSDNKYIKKEYNEMRHKVSRVLREIHITKEQKSPELHLKRLEALKEKANKSDVLTNGTLDKLIREQKISSVMATSLVNDSNKVADIMKKLIETAELLYIDSDTLISLSEQEEVAHG
ncbi:Na/Pi cotransporter family protein [Neolewinella persica]|uniref:Na/Pi cotransporter family protein n=1 Tax=Neolewinella persica TaxID=70998 RepID=UPI0003A61555|nr:Na/Pi symporter [Neolewinella persica]